MQPVKKQRNYFIHLIIGCIMWALLWGCSPVNHVIKKTTDDRGYTSIVMINCNNDTIAFDYLDRHELDSITHK